MKRDELRELGLSDEQIDGVLAKHHQDIKNADEAMSKLEDLTTENDELKNQLQERDSDMKKLQKMTKDNEELSSQVSEWEDKYKKSQEDFSAKLTATKLDTAVTAKLGETKARDMNVVKKLIDMDAVSLNEDGSVSGLDEQLKSLQSDQAYLFEGGTKQTGYNPAGEGSGEKTSIANALGIVDTK